MFSSKSIDNSRLTDKLKEGLMRSHNLIAFCENYGDYAIESKSAVDKFLITLCSAHLDFSSIPPLTIEQYDKNIISMMTVISKDSMLIERLQSLCKAEIEEEFYEHEDSLKKEQISKNIKILIDFHKELCRVINTPKAKADAKSINDTVHIWETEIAIRDEESKQVIQKKEKYPKTMSYLKVATHVLGISGIFKTPNEMLFFGSFFYPDLMKQEFLKFLIYFAKQSHCQELEEKEKEKLKAFTEGLSITKNLTQHDIVRLLEEKKSLVMASGWKNKKDSHCVGFYVFTNGGSLNLVCCNRGAGINFVNDEKGKPFFSGNIILSIPNNKQGKEAISKLFANDSLFNTFKYENAEKFYNELNKFLKYYHFTAIEYQPLKQLKRNNCTVGDQKSLLRAILSNRSYKILTTEWRRKEITHLLTEVKNCVSAKISLKKCLEVQILYNYLLQTESAFARNKINKQKLLSTVYAELSKIYEIAANSSVENENCIILQRLLKRFENDKALGCERYKFLQNFKKQEELNRQWDQLQRTYKEVKMTMPKLLIDIYNEFLRSPNIETVEAFKAILLRGKNITQHPALLELLSAIFNTIDKMKISAMSIEKISSNDNEFSERISKRNSI